MHRNTGEVDRDDLVPFLLGDIGCRAGFLFRPGVVEGDVKTPERADRLVQCGLHVLGPGHVAADGKSLPAEIGDHAGRLLVALIGDIGEHYAGALSGERHCRCAAHAAARAGHEGDSASEAFVRIR